MTHRSCKAPNRTVVVVVVALLLVTIPLTIAVAQSTPGHDGHSEENGTPVPAQPPGERNPLVGIIAGVAILVVGAAGIFIYRIIKEGI